MKKSNYLIFSDAKWVSTLVEHPPIKIKGTIKLYIGKNNLIDRRCKEYKTLMKSAPKNYIGIEAQVETI